jgi:tetratricopeptide (TPR) repeat protein
LKKLVSKNQLPAVLVITVCVIVAAAHWPVLSAKALLFDDDLFVGEDSPLVQNPGWALAGRALAEVFNPSVMVGYYQPLPVISIMADCAMGGNSRNLVPFRRTGLVIHIFNTALVVSLLYFLFGHPIPAAMGGLLFGVHPLSVEPVAWISDRKTLLAMFFVLWCLIFYVRFAQKGGRKSYFACMLMYLFALMSKPTSLPVPVLMLVLDYWPLRRFNRKAVIEKTPFFVLGIVFAVITTVSNNRSLGIPLSSRLEGPAQLLRTFLTVCYLIIFYLRKIFWPMNLSSVYVLPEPLSLSNWVISASVFGTFVLIGGMFFSLRLTRAFLAGLLFFFLAILPVLGIVPFSNWVVASDKYVYMPIIGLLAVFGWAITSLWKKIAVPKTALIVLLLFLSSVQIYCLRRYLSHWRDTVSLFEHMLTLTPNAVQVHNDLGIELRSLGRTDEAISHFQQALKLKRDYAEAHNNLGFAFHSLGRMDEAIEEYRKAVRIKPDYSQAYNNLGAALWSQGRFDEAIKQFSQALKIRPDYAEAHYNMGRAFQSQSRIDEATGQFYQALRIKPDYPAAHAELGNFLSARNRYSEAINHYRLALRSNPDWPAVLNNLAWILATSPIQNKYDTNEAITLAERAAKLTKYQDAAMLDTLAAAYSAGGQSDKAVATGEKALQIASTDPNKQLADQIRRQLEMYRKAKP